MALMSFKDEFKITIKTRFLSGVLVIVPLFVTLAILKFVVESIDNFIKPYIVKILGQDYGFPYIGLAVTLLLIMLTGILTTNVFGQKIYRLWEKFLLKIPFFRTLYIASKQLIEGIAVPDKKTFEKVVMVEYPRKGSYALGFLANRLKIHLADGEKEFWSVFIPSTPTPFSGMAILFPAGEAKILDISVEDGIKFFVSGSISAPRQIRAMERIESKSPEASTHI
jgi:uncharacterized membrane protein